MAHKVALAMQFCAEPCSDDRVRSLLDALPGEDQARDQARTNFDELCKIRDQVNQGERPDWILKILEGYKPTELRATVHPFALVLEISEDVYKKIRPGSAGVTLTSDYLPESLRSRLVILPTPAKADQTCTLRHEVFHSLEGCDAPPTLYNSTLFNVARTTTDAGSLNEMFQRAMLSATFQSRSEVVAYAVGGENPYSIEPLGFDKALRAFDALRKGLSLNVTMSEEFKLIVFKFAQSQVATLIRETIEFRGCFLQHAQNTSLEYAAAMHLSGNLTSTDVSGAWSTRDGVRVKFDALLAEVPATQGVDSIKWWKDEWRSLCKELKLCPHQDHFPNICKALELSNNHYFISDMLHTLEPILYMAPPVLNKDIAQNLTQRLRQIANKDGIEGDAATEQAKRILEHIEFGMFDGSLFSGKNLTPEGKVAEVFRSKEPAALLCHLLTNEFPNRDPFWDTLPLGFFTELFRDAPVSQRISVFSALAQHSSNGFDVRNAVSWLAFYIERPTMSDEPISNLSEVLRSLPATAESLGGDEQSCASYLRDFGIIEAFCQNGSNTLSISARPAEVATLAKSAVREENATPPPLKTASPICNPITFH